MGGDDGVHHRLQLARVRHLPKPQAFDDLRGAASVLQHGGEDLPGCVARDDLPVHERHQFRHGRGRDRQRFERLLLEQRTQLVDHPVAHGFRVGVAADRLLEEPGKAVVRGQQQSVLRPEPEPVPVVVHLRPLRRGERRMGRGPALRGGSGPGRRGPRSGTPLPAGAVSPPHELEPRVPQRHDAVEDERVRGGVRVDAEVSQPLELEPVPGTRGPEARLHAAPDGLQRPGVQQLPVVPVRVGLGVRCREQPVVEPELGFQGMGRGHPMDRPLHLPAAGAGAASGLRVVGAAQLPHPPGGRVPDRFLALDDVGVAQPHLAPRREPVVPPGGIFEEVVFLDVDLTGEGERPRPFPGHVPGEVGRLQLLGPAFGVVGEDHLERARHRQDPGRPRVQVVADAVLQLVRLHRVVALGDADAAAEVADGLGGVTPSSESRQCGHARVVPTGHAVLLHELQEPALAHDRVVEVQPRELDLPRGGGRVHLSEDPVVELAVVLELQGAQRVGHSLQRVRQGMGEIVHGVDGPGVAGVVVGHVADTVDHGVAHLHVRRGHVDLRPQHVRAVRELPPAHAGEQVPVLRRGAVAVGALPARLGHRAAAFAYGRLAQAANVGAAPLDELDGKAVEFVEVVRGVVQAAAPVEPQPADVVLDGLCVEGVLLGRVGVVEAQVAASAELLGDPEVEADGLGVADVEEPVGLGRKARHHAARVPARGHVLPDDGANEVRGRLALPRIAVLGRLAHAPPVPAT